MTKKNTIRLTFNYNFWSAPVTEADMTKSAAKMKKLLTADIKHVLVNGFKRYGDREPAMKLQLPFFPQILDAEAKIKVTFADGCTFKCEKFSKILKTRTEFGEVTVDGNVLVEVEWKC